MLHLLLLLLHKISRFTYLLPSPSEKVIYAAKFMHNRLMIIVLAALSTYWQSLFLCINKHILFIELLSLYGETYFYHFFPYDLGLFLWKDTGNHVSILSHQALI